MCPEIDRGVIEFNRSKAQARACMNFRKGRAASVLAKVLAAMQHRAARTAAGACHSDQAPVAIETQAEKKLQTPIGRA
jgi:hypothetical protein